MSGDKVCSPKSGACTIIVYYSYSLGIPTYQKALFLHVYVLLWLLKKKFLAHIRMLSILISSTPVRERGGNREALSRDLLLLFQDSLTPMLLAEVW